MDLASPSAMPMLESDLIHYVCERDFWFSHIKEPEF